MFADIEKAFDTAFFNADHNLKIVLQVITNFEDVVLSEDLSAALGGAISAIGTQLSTMAFCFAQLMCKSILYSENYFVLKVSWYNVNKILKFIKNHLFLGTISTVAIRKL